MQQQARLWAARQVSPTADGRAAGRCCSGPASRPQRPLCRSEEFRQNGGGMDLSWQVAQQAEVGKRETWGHTATHQAPGAEATGRLPVAVRHHGQRFARAVAAQ